VNLVDHVREHDLSSADTASLALVLAESGSIINSQA
jgi:hypothetical protein